MSYNSYTNESDTQLAEQLDRFKLGRGSSPDISPYAASEAALSMLPLQMDVAQLMQARASLGAQSMNIRKGVADDATRRQEQDEFDSYLMEARDSYEPGNEIRNSQVRQDLFNKYQGNPLVERSLELGQRSSSWASESKRNRNQDAEMDFEYENRGVAEKLKLEQTRLNLQQTEYNNERFKQLKDAEDMDLVDKAGKTFGNVYDQDPDMFNAGMSFIKQAHLDGNYGMIRNIATMMGSFSTSYMLEEGYSDEIKKTQVRQAALKSETGIDLFNAKPEEKEVLYSQAEQKLREKYAKDPAKLEGAIGVLKQTVEFDRKMTELTGGRDVLRQQMTDWMKRKPADMNSPEGRAWQGEEAVLTMKAAKYNGIVEKRFAERKREQDNAERNQTLFNKHLDMLKKQQDIKFGPQNQAFKQAIIDMRRDKMDADRMAMVFRAVGAIDGKNVMNADDLKQKIKEVLPMIEDDLGLEPSGGALPGL